MGRNDPTISLLSSPTTGRPTRKYEMSRPPLPRALKEAVLRAPQCHLCGGVRLEIEGETWVVDHLQPYSRGGTDQLENLAKAHSTCNAWRGTRPVTERLRQQIARRRRVELFVQD